MRSFQFTEIEQNILDSITTKLKNSLEEEKIYLPFLIIVQWFKEFERQSILFSFIKVLALLIFIGLIILGFITSYASLSLLWSTSFSSNQVEFANSITNAGALFACITDLPAILYFGFYLPFVKETYYEVLREIYNRNYHLCIQEYTIPAEETNVFSPTIRETIYRQHIEELRNLRLHFYINPDSVCETGLIHKELSPILEKIDEEISGGISYNDFVCSTIEIFKEQNCVKQIFKIFSLFIMLFIIGLSMFLIYENSILIIYTPDSDLFSTNITQQNTEAFYLTQLGGVFSSLTAFGASNYIIFYLFIKDSYRQVLRNKIISAFNNNTPPDLPENQKEELENIKKYKITIIS